MILDGISVEGIDWDGSLEHGDRHATPDTSKPGGVVVFIDHVNALQSQVHERSAHREDLGRGDNLKRPELVGRRTSGDNDRPRNEDSVEEFVIDLSVAGEVTDGRNSAFPVLVEVIDQNLDRGEDVFIFLGSGLLRCDQLVAVLLKCRQESQKELWFHLTSPIRIQTGKRNF